MVSIDGDDGGRKSDVNAGPHASGGAVVAPADAACAGRPPRLGVRCRAPMAIGRIQVRRCCSRTVSTSTWMRLAC